MNCTVCYRPLTSQDPPPAGHARMAPVLTRGACVDCIAIAVATANRYSHIGPTAEPPTSDVPGDQGGLNAALTIRGNRVHLDFGTTLSWVSMTKDEATTFAAELMKKAAQLPS